MTRPGVDPEAGRLVGLPVGPDVESLAGPKVGLLVGPEVIILTEKEC